MADENGNGAAGSTPPSGNTGGPPNPASNADVVSIPRQEYDKLARYGDQVKGFQPFHQKATAYGFKSAEDFDRYDPWLKQIQTLEKRGVKADMLARMFNEEADADLNEKPRHEIDLAKFESELMGKWRKELAEKEYNELSNAEKTHLDAVLREHLGDEKVDDMNQFMYENAIENLSYKVRDVYPKDHPLAGVPQPFTEKSRPKLLELLKAEKAKRLGSSMKDKADAAIAAKKKPPTPAGSGAGQGKPKNESSNKSPREEIDDLVEQAMS